MTGFGKAEVSDPNFSMTIEVRSVNSRYFDYSSKLPGFLNQFDLTAGRIIKERCIRGRITLAVTTDFNGNTVQEPYLNEDLLKQYQELVSFAGQQTGLDTEIGLEHYLTLPDVIQMHSILSDEELE